MNHFFVYVAFSDYRELLCQELGQINMVDENLVFSNQEKLDCCFAQDVWLNPIMVNFHSITQAVNILRAKQLYWYLYPFRCIRRSRLIADQLKNPFPKWISFPSAVRYPQTGVFCLLDQNTLLFSTHHWRSVPIGTVFFQEDKVNPPNRAYLKLWEAFTMLGRYPQEGERALDLGASPGGWSWVLANLRAQVVALDKAPLAVKLQQHPQIQFLSQSAFAIEPEKQATFDWLCADIACYPERLLMLLKRWIKAGTAKQIIATIKLQGKNDLAAITPFQQIAGGMVKHLFYNKHEATFFYPWKR